MKYAFILIRISLAAFAFSACRNDTPDSTLTTISVLQSDNNQKLSDWLHLEGFTSLHVSDMQGIDRFRSASKVLFANGKIIVLDRDTDFKTVWLFDANSGARLGKIDYRNDGAPGGLQDIALLSNDELCTLEPQERGFRRYGLDGQYHGSLANGVVGDRLLCRPNGDYIVYNEYCATPVSGYHQLLYFDRAGNLSRQACPYPEAVDNSGYLFSGFLSASNQSAWFSPPFCDTVYELVQSKIVPRYVFDFGGASVPEQLRSSKVSGWDLDAYAYLSEDFIKINDIALFKYFSNQRVHLGFYNERSKVYLNCRNAAQDGFSELLNGAVFPKGDNAFAVVLSPARIKYLLEHQRVDMEQLKTLSPELQAALARIDPAGPIDPLLLYFSFASPLAAAHSN
ncbi:MAG: 6-bladed beta-propeller [Saprospiraceae bacterium]|nr:6-bladed beta-propeller [Saprospiraceae bacterium]